MRLSLQRLGLHMLKADTQAQLCFKLGDEIGSEGKNSTVFRAHDIQMDAQLAIKRITKSSIKDAADYYREASILYMGDHANVVPIHYACEDTDHIYLAMPYYPNGSLNGLLEQRFLTVREIVRYGIQFLSGLHNIHSKKLIHFDIKPDNILLSSRNEALLSDFGLAQRMRVDGKAEPPVSYVKNIPPEALVESEHSVAFDIYQVGLTLYRMCCGNDAFYEPLKQFKSFADFSAAVQKGAFPDRSTFPAHIPNPLRTLVKKCLSVDVNARYGAIIEVSNALGSIEGNELDWQYEVYPDGGREWTKSVDGREFTLTVTGSGESTATRRTEKTVSKLKDFCAAKIDEKTIRKFLKEY
ncbi:serine/threonine-protein kinase [Burkholderia oklahomensis]|uniref:serine/threonine-protein kinase n=2 Tax=Burkholderia oklahomensis TaxID=342113 RepID=UPI000A4EF1AE|nr:serine/threonine-protein kinase [Burkholderia oklahomensis]